jgi:pimeloyl-ACP methyl ester carboxylesterase
VLSVDPLGAVGDGGEEEFGAEMLARVPEADRERARMLDEKDTAGEATQEDHHDAFALFWPSYFADPAAAPTMPRVEFSGPASRQRWADLQTRLPELESSLPSITVPFGVLVGELSPMPPSAGTQSADRIPGAWSHVEPGAGHFVWVEAPGCVLAAMDRLVAGA